MASFAFRVEGIEPANDPVWRLMDPSVRQAFWRAVVGFTLEAKDRELAAGLDRLGDPLTPIAPSTRARGRKRSYTGLGSAGNPPLTPAGALSRTRALLTGRALVNSAEFYWTYDTVSGLPWGQMLGWHRAGAGGLPKRDVIGLAPQSLAAVKAQADRWWKNYKATHPVFEHEKVQIKTIKATTTIPLTGRIDLEHAVLGVGAEKKIVAEAIKAGTFTGFRQLPPRSKAALKPERITPETPKLTRIQAGAEVQAKAAQAAAEAKAAAEAHAQAVAEAHAQAAASAAAEAKAATQAKARARAKAAAEAKVIARAKTEAEAQTKAAATQARKVTATPAMPGTIGRSEVETVLAGKIRPSEKNAAILALVQEHQSAVPVMTQVAGMSTPESFHTLTFDGMKFYFPPVVGAPGQMDAIVIQIRALASLPPLPPGLTRYTQEIYNTTQRNKDDAYWAKEYNKPDFKSRATGGFGKVTMYNGESLSVPTLAHEMGHNLSQGVYGAFDPPIESAYRKAMASGEPPVSEYAKNSPAEDFAEAARLYVLEPAGLARIAPKRYAALKDLIDVPTT